MFYIDINRENIIKARDEHIKSLIPTILNKVNKLENGNKIKTCLTEEKIKWILGESPKKLRQINLLFLRNIIPDFKLQDWEDYLKIKKTKSFNTEENHLKGVFDDTLMKAKEIFDYDNFNKKKSTKYNAYNLAKNLDIPTCPYCGRMYTKTVGRKNGKKITRPTFDHWFPKSKYPLLALSFYNLIPSCNICNSSVKGDAEFALNTHFHPYNKVDNLKYTFSYDLKHYEEPDIKIKAEKGISENSVKAFELEEIYKTHNDELGDLLKIKQAYSERYIDILNNMLNKGITLSKEEVYRLAFGAYLDEDKFDRRPLSKMKKDILTELRIIK